MPDLDFALLADHVRAEGGVAHVIAAGVDTVYAAQVPSGQNLALLARFSFTRNECGRPHRVELIFQDEDGARLLELRGVLTPPWNEELPVGWRMTYLWALNFGVPLPKYGAYAFELLLNDSNVETLRLRVVPAPPPEAGAS